MGLGCQTCYLRRFRCQPTVSSILQKHCTVCSIQYGEYYGPYCNQGVHLIYVILFSYTFAQTLIVLEPNSATPTGPWTEGDVDNVLIGIENHDDFTQANIDSGRVAYSVGIIYGTYQGSMDSAPTTDSPSDGEKMPEHI